VLALRSRRVAPVRIGAPQMRFFALIAVLGTILPNSASYQAAVHLPAGIMAILISFVPIFAFPVALLMRVDRFGWARLGGLGLGAAGVLLIVAPGSSLPDPAMVAFVPLALVAPACYALEGNIIARFGTAGMDPVLLLFGASVLGALGTLPMALATGSFIDPRLPWALPDTAIDAGALRAEASGRDDAPAADGTDASGTTPRDPLLPPVSLAGTDTGDAARPDGPTPSDAPADPLPDAKGRVADDTKPDPAPASDTPATDGPVADADPDIRQPADGQARASAPDASEPSAAVTDGAATRTARPGAGPESGPPGAQTPDRTATDPAASDPVPQGRGLDPSATADIARSGAAEPHAPGPSDPQVDGEPPVPDDATTARRSGAAGGRSGAQPLSQPSSDTPSTRA
jgi:hypothetical protein